MVHYRWLDHCINHFHHSLQTLCGPLQTTERPYPAAQHPEPVLTSREKRHVAGLLRVNHAGEIAAQGLYQGQAMTALEPAIQQQMQQAAREENDHLAWCEQRLHELNSRTSYLKPCWYVGSLIIGNVAGLWGDRWSLAFVEETENQVVDHLQNHLSKLPAQDEKSLIILQQMQQDEARHAHNAKLAGAAQLPPPIKLAMRLAAKVMTKTAYWV